MNITETKLALRESLLTDITEKCEALLPGLTDVAWREVNKGGAGFEEQLIGFWHGQAVDLTSGPTTGVYLVQHCARCDAYVTSRSIPISTRFDSLAYLDDPDRTKYAAELDACFSCTWLAEAQADAAKVTGRLSAYRFKATRGVDHLSVLARSR